MCRKPCAYGERVDYRVGMRTVKKTNGHKPPRPLSEMTPAGRRLYELSEKSIAATKKRLTVDDINRLLAERRGGIVKSHGPQ